VFTDLAHWRDVPDPEPWTTLSSRQSFANPWLSVTEHDVGLPDGRTGYYGVVRCARAVGMLPFVDDDTVLMVRQWRYVAGRATWEMPTGGAHADEALIDAVQRELAEEVGAHAGRVTEVPMFNTSKGMVDEEAYLYLCHDLTPATALPDDTEFLGVGLVPFDTVLDWVLSGEVVDAMTIVAVLHADRLRRR
jgi:8-oxo-dGTP pyrophosphatase MutT (NUDIX family)